jgi:predicted nucleic acid-binding Zn finger protein
MKFNLHSAHLATVQSETSKNKYEVNLEKGTCSCPDYLFRGLPTPGYRCKHIKEVAECLNVQI